VKSKIPVSEAARQLRQSEICHLTETVARSLRFEVLVLLKQSYCKPNLPTSKAHHSRQQHRKPPSRGNFSQNPRMHPSSIGSYRQRWFRFLSGFGQGSNNSFPPRFHVGSDVCLQLLMSFDFCLSGMRILDNFVLPDYEGSGGIPYTDALCKLQA